MADDPFDNLESTLRSGGPEAGFDLLIGKFREEKKYPLVFEARLMKSRHALGLPLIQNERLEDLPEAKRVVHERDFMADLLGVGTGFDLQCQFLAKGRDRIIRQQAADFVEFQQFERVSVHRRVPAGNLRQTADVGRGFRYGGWSPGFSRV